MAAVATVKNQVSQTTKPTAQSEAEIQLANLKAEVRVLSRMLQQETLAHKQTQLNAEIALDRVSTELETLRKSSLNGAENNIPTT